MKYKITVLKFEENEDYEEELAKWRERSGFNFHNNFNNFPEEPRRETAVRSLDVFLTEEEYEAVKKAVLSTFK